ncbi:plastocyanin/azurin family copper-binding protein [Halococcus saccharolyticus]|uniref:Halocyanin-like protein n=1 Tax=Halococcus saccharolyticus DSM 5350 TaxID=1227455 RepID=M0MM84_9EURY|nr:plastocyanin/azurin family copper-binding protein [Halococcus saccharolyticus]EMA45849.1 halocyanin precursor-like protein [Halococcus saccharolyticus DSM 5350]
MSETDADGPVSRRGFLRTAAGAAAVAGTSGTAAAQEGNSSSGGGGGGTTTVEVGTGSGTSFGPEEATIAPGGTVVWEWTGEGGAHNVVADDGAFDSGSPEEGSGITFEHTFEETGEFPYHCAPHEAVGMVGTIIVQEGGASSGGESSGPVVPNSAKTLGVATMSFMLSTLGLAYVFMKYGGDYREHTE